MPDNISVIRNIRTRLDIEGEKEFKQAIADVNRELKTHKSELALVQSHAQQGAARQTR